METQAAVKPFISHCAERADQLFAVLENIFLMLISIYSLDSPTFFPISKELIRETGRILLLQRFIVISQKHEFKLFENLFG